MRKIKQEELDNILVNHKHWIDKDCDGYQEMRADLRGADLRGADLRYANLSEANLSCAEFSGTDLRCTGLSYADLSGADLRGADLRGADLRGADLRGADLNEANLSYADLSYADLSCTDLSEANFSEANLRYTGLCCADLSEANLSCADLSEANLRGANLSEADLSKADLSDSNLSGVHGLVSPIDFLKEQFESTSDGIIAYKAFDAEYSRPKTWIIQKGSIITENVNPCRTRDCGCGINVAPLNWVVNNYPNNSDIWKVLIHWEWLPGVVVPYNTDGKIRCERVELIDIVKQ